MKKQLRALGDFWREEYGRWVGMTAVAFLVLVVLSYGTFGFENEHFLTVSVLYLGKKKN